MPSIPVANPGTTSTEFVPSEAKPAIKFFVKRWTPSTSPPTAAVLFIHGFLENIERYDHVFPVFASKGIAVTAFDQRGFGKTAKDGTDSWKKNHGNTTRSLQYQDIAQFLKDERKRLDQEYGPRSVPLFLVGHSMGGGLALATFTRPKSEAFFPSAVLQDVKGVVALAPWLLLVDNPPSIVPTAAGYLISIYPGAKKQAPLNPEYVSKDPEVVAEYRKNPFTNPNVYLKAIHGPLASGLNILNKEYVNFPNDKPLLIVHGTADKVCDIKGSRDFIQRVQADDKQLIEMEGLYHELHNEQGDEKVKAINHVIDWILAHAKSPGGPESSASAPSASAAPVTATSVPTSADTSAKKAWATLLTGEKYLPGLFVFSRSLLHGRNASRYPLIVMVTDDVSAEAQQVIKEMGCIVRRVDALMPTQKSEMLAEERFSLVWTKLRAFELEEYERVILIDSDMLVRRNMDELMTCKLDSDSGIAASFACTCNPRKVASYPASWISANCAFTPQSHPDALTHPTTVTPESRDNYHLLNSGLVVLTPSKAVMEDMSRQIATDPEIPAFRFPDQDFLAKYYKGRFTPLPWVYNALKPLRKCHTNIWRDEEVRNVHYILDKPWAVGYPGNEEDDPDAVTHSWWWKAYEDAKAHREGLLAESDQWEEYIGRFVREEPRDVVNAAQPQPALGTPAQAIEAHL
ncbi:glycosyltransferase family 8 protein [Tilletiaria anomala UBC 951]|uniref:Glycosyltransferase family 8 protein n=1 Tax=Tilletiaria anomala (strain ATCC 24038 / CBS 436.72 / UBC 951) TaxID=1037660 RepID=A0A066WL01_TILAU|nr:glycosyltransferase family 8 protein [Tilletiaria anomala UBC 951]KDN53253.1 glycosyltransferase family 8 protein [Tilletiaria anomala UBC 951]